MLLNNMSVISWRSVLLLGKTTDLSQVTDKVYHICLKNYKKTDGQGGTCLYTVIGGGGGVRQIMILPFPHYFTIFGKNIEKSERLEWK